MIRLMGAVLLVLAAIGLAMCAVRYLNKRVADLKQLQYGLKSMAREMDYRLAPLPELLRLAERECKGSASVFFNLCAQGVEHLNGRSFQNVWQHALEAAQLRLENDDLEVLEQLGAVLGRYDSDSQQRAIDGALARLEQQRYDAETQSSRSGRLYSVLSLTAAGFLLIILI